MIKCIWGKRWILILAGLIPIGGYGQNKPKEVSASYTAEKIIIDGLLSETAWKKAETASNFMQYAPYNGKPSRQRTEVKILYRHDGICFGAELYDTSPDSILLQYGTRDSDGLNADYFSVAINPYNDGLNKWVFLVYANGVQYDAKGTNDNEDEDWNAAWSSAARLNDKGWTAELFIPYSMLRFPKKKIQDWDINFWRSIRRYREESSWNHVTNEIQGDIIQSGRLTGLKNISPPLRLSLSPYISGYMEKSPGKKAHSFFNYGADVKFGISESFTLDMTLIPDFGQVESDDEVYNLTPFEVKYDEKRQFFTEGTELFNRQDVFYSRRIGDKPLYSDKVQNHLQPGDSLVSNPAGSPILNATKLSGRTHAGTGIGIFNAITSSTHATLMDSAGVIREVLTQPLSNYNMVVVDQNVLKNSRIGIFNTHVFRGKNETISTVSGTDWEFKNASNSHTLVGNVKVSSQLHPEEKNNHGLSYNLSMAKIKGKIRYDAGTWSHSAQYNPNAMGYLNNNNETGYYGSVYLHRLQPKNQILNSTTKLYILYAERFEDHKFQDFYITLSHHLLNKNHLSLGSEITLSPLGVNDFYEPRTSGYFYHKPSGYEASIWYSPDYRKTFVVDTRFFILRIPETQHTAYQISIGPRYRLSNHAFVEMEFQYHKAHNDYGYATTRKNAGQNEILFGSRDVTTFENQLSGQYIFTAHSGITIKARHYAITGLYHKFYRLQTDGTLKPSEYSGIHDFSFNAFTIDLAYNWFFAPASSLSLVWKNAIYTQGAGDETQYFTRLRNTLAEEATNSVSLKILYYIDYQKVKGVFIQRRNTRKND